MTTFKFCSKANQKKKKHFFVNKYNFIDLRRGISNLQPLESIMVTHKICAHTHTHIV